MGVARYTRPRHIGPQQNCEIVRKNTNMDSGATTCGLSGSSQPSR